QRSLTVGTFGDRRSPLQCAHRPALILLFAKKFFRARSNEPIGSKLGRASRSRMRWSGRIFWLLAFGAVDSFQLSVDSPSLGASGHQLSTINYRLTPPSSRLHRHFGNDWPWEVVSSYSS